jgi:formylglycine-generating enzyme required for sulfatase activity
MAWVRKVLYTYFFAAFCLGCSLHSSTQEKLEVVTYAQFERFVSETGYVTDAEKFGWSIVQQDVYNFIKVKGADWRKPDGSHAPTSKKLPVTQVSYNDAVAYCKWSNSRLPTYDEYWLFIENDKRKVISDNNGFIAAANTVNILGNVWEITSTENNGNIRLAGGSLFCSPNTCHGTTKERELYVDKQTGNLHIGFAVIK